MRLLVVHPGASSSTSDVADGLYYGLEHHGVDLVRYRLDQRIDRAHNWLHYNWKRTRKKNPDLQKPTTADVFYQAASEAVLVALRHQVDCVLIVSSMFFHPDSIILMKRAGLRVCVLFTESPYDQEREIEIAKLVDGCWTSERASLDAFRAVNAHVGYVPHGWHPFRHVAGPQPDDDAVPAHDVVFVGTAFYERVALLSSIDWDGVDLGLYGNWQTLSSRHRLRRYVRDGVVYNERAAALYRRAAICLNLYRTLSGWGPTAPTIGRADSLNPRAYELARCGAFSVSHHRAEVAEVFGDLVPTFRNAFEASSLIRRWLADPDGRAKAKADLPARVAESSWVERAACVIGDIQTLLQHRAA